MQQARGVLVLELARGGLARGVLARRGPGLVRTQDTVGEAGGLRSFADIVLIALWHARRNRYLFFSMAAVNIRFAGSNIARCQCIWAMAGAHLRFRSPVLQTGSTIAAA
jgi:hypothetical protein